MKVYVKLFGNTQPLENSVKGEWVDLSSRINVDIPVPYANTLKRKRTVDIDSRTRDVYFNNILIPLGIAMKLPKGFEAIIAPRSSTFNKFGIISGNSIGIIDNSYNGDNDEWKFSAIGLQPCTISEGHRICQFRIQLSQKATIIQKLKWLFTNKITFIYVDKLNNNNNRGGFGSTGY